MTRIAFAVMAVLMTMGALTACYNKPPQERAAAHTIR